MSVVANNSHGAHYITLSEPSDTDLDARGLFGREGETAILKEAFRRCISQHKANNELVLVSGPSGTGKSALARALQPVVEEKYGGFFVAAKFDQLERPEQYYPIVRGFTDWVQLVLSQNNDAVNDIRNALETIGEADQILLDLIPALNHLLENTASRTQTAMGPDAHKRLMTSFRGFIRSVCSHARPLVLFLDDLQWADDASLDLMATLVRDSSIRGLLVLGACRGNEVAIDQPLAVTLREIEAEQIDICNIELGGLTPGSVQHLVEDVLQNGSPEECRFLADLACRATDASPFFVHQLLRFLSEEGQLLPHGTLARWKSEVEYLVQTKFECSSSLRFLETSLLRLPQSVQNVLKTAACFGSEFIVSFLEHVSDENVGDALSVAALRELVEEHSSGVWRFTHDQVQQSCYSLISEDDVAAFHLSIGRKLSSELSLSELSNHIFLVVNQFLLSAPLLTDQDERDSVAHLLLKSGEESAKSASFMTAATHLEFGIGLLGERHWRDQYSLSLDLYNAAAEVQYCNGNFDRVKELVEDVFLNARNHSDKARASTTLIFVLGSNYEVKRGIEVGFQALRDLGEPIPAKVSPVAIYFEMMKTKRMFLRLSDQHILSLPHMNDANKFACMRIMNLLCFMSCHVSPMHAPLLAFRLVQMSIKHGISGMSSVGFASFGFILFQVQNDPVGLRASQIAIELLNKFEAREWLPRVYFCHYGLCMSVTEPLRDQLHPILVAHREGLGTGDLEFSMMSASFYAYMGFNSCVPLREHLSDADNFLELMALHRQTSTEMLVRPVVQVMSNFVGRCDDPLVLNGKALQFDLALEEAISESNVTNITLLHYVNLIHKAFFGRFDEADKAGVQLFKCSTNSLSIWIRALAYLCHSVAILASRGRRSRSGKKIVRRNLRKLKAFSRLSHHYYLNKIFFLEAELAAAGGKLHLASAMYEDAIESASRQKLWSEAGFAHERLASFFRENGRQDRAIKHLHSAILAYQKWGASSKVEQIKAQVSLEQTSRKVEQIKAQVSLEQSSTGTTSTFFAPSGEFTVVE